MYKGLISIILPCYQAEDFIAGIINDVIRQSYIYWELIVVSNGTGQEKQLEIIEEIASVEKRIHIISLQTAGVSSARNIGVKEAKGEWITFLDADDRIEPVHLQNYVVAIDETSELIVMGYTIITRNGKDFSRLSPCDSKDSSINECIEQLLNYGATALNSLWNKLIRRSVLVSTTGLICFDKELEIAEDLIFNLTYLKRCKRIQIIPAVSYLYNYNVNDNAASSIYQPSKALAVSLSKMMFYDIYLFIGYTDECAKQRVLKWYYYEVYQQIINLFRKGCPLSPAKKYQEIRQLISSKEFQESMSYKNKKENIIMSIYGIGAKIQNPLFLLVVLGGLRKVYAMSQFYKANRSRFYLYL